MLVGMVIDGIEVSDVGETNEDMGGHDERRGILGCIVDRDTRTA